MKSYQDILREAKKPKPVRFEQGKLLSASERKQVLASIGDAYKDNDAPRELKYIDDRSGEEIWGYAYSPESMYVSDVTGARIRYYVFLPNGWKAHPSELFPNMTKAEIDKEMLKREEKERHKEMRKDQLLARAKAADNLGDANFQFNSVAGLVNYTGDSTVYKKGKMWIRVANEDVLKGAFKKDHKILKKLGFKLVSRLEKGKLVIEK